MQSVSKYPNSGSRGPKVVALGGGHGLYASLAALKLLTRNITAIVTVGDDGGSSGRLREEFGVLPPGDLRMALAALCDDSDWGQTWRDVLQYRFTSDGALNGHSLGNLLITGLWDLLKDPVAGLDWVGRLLNVKGRVVPMAKVPLQIEAEVTAADGGKTFISGQAAVAKCAAPITNLRINPENPPVCAEALTAIAEADWVIFGPGSWYTSVLPHLMVPTLYQALCNSRAKKILVLNLIADSETSEMSAADLAKTFHEFGPELKINAILVDPTSVISTAALRDAITQLGALPFQRNIANPLQTGSHDPLYLAAAYREIFGNFDAVR